MRTEGRLTDYNNRAEFEAAVLPWLDALYRLALRLTREPPDAADLVQETCLRAYRTFQNFQPGTNCRAWLFTILYSIFINQQRRHSRQGVSVSVDTLDQGDDVAVLSRADASDTIVHDAVPGLAAGPEVTRALRDLSDEFRAAVVLVDGAGMTYEEAAAVLQCPVGTVRSRLYRARQHLAAALREYAMRSGFAGGDS